MQRFLIPNQIRSSDTLSMLWTDNFNNNLFSFWGNTQEFTIWVHYFSVLWFIKNFEKVNTGHVNFERNSKELSETEHTKHKPKKIIIANHRIARVEFFILFCNRAWWEIISLPSGWRFWIASTWGFHANTFGKDIASTCQ